MLSGTRHEDELAESHEINVTPFIDVMLVLLIIFMVAAPLATVDVPVDLPASTAPPQPKPDKPLYLTIRADSSLVLGSDEVSLANLPGALKTASQDNTQQRIFLRADKSVNYATLMQTMNKLREAGYLKIALVGLEKVGLEKVGLEKVGLEKVGLEKVGLEKAGLEKAGLEKVGVEQPGLETAGLGKARLESAVMDGTGS